MNEPRRHCAWSACSRLYVQTWGGQSYCGHKACPASRIVPEYGPRPITRKQEG